MEDLALLEEMYYKMHQIIDLLDEDGLTLSSALQGDVYDSYIRSLQNDRERLNEELVRLRRCMDEIGLSGS